MMCPSQPCMESECVTVRVCRMYLMCFAQPHITVDAYQERNDAGLVLRTLSFELLVMQLTKQYCPCCTSRVAMAYPIRVDF